jgi:tetratricopeptide (TPR) repeat protein
MAAALEALDRGELARARSAFEEAAALSPGSEAAADGLARVEAAEQLEAIAAHRRRAESLEAEEDWEAAVGEYDAVLALDPAIRFAVLGRERAGARRALARDLDRHLSRPDRLAADEVLEEARELVERARRITPPGPRLAEAIEKLEEQIAVASTPVRVVLLSDGLTEVLVYRVGRLGTFERRELDLRPGRYTVVGARAGFRDVRHELEVSPGGGAGPLTVRCEEGV